MTISSPAFGYNQTIPERFTCEGENISPPLEISEVPDNAETLVLIVEDPDAPNGTWIHWLVFNIPAIALSIGENAIPLGGTVGHANNDTPGYEGPCPPSGVHRYIFRVYAVDTRLDVPTTADAGIVREAMEGHILTEAEHTGRFFRSP